MTIIYIDDPMVSGPDWMRDTLTATAELAYDPNQSRVPAGSSGGGRWGGGAGGGRYKGAAAAETERVAAAARRGVDESEFDGPVMHRGLAINVSDDLKRRIDTQMYSGAEPDEFNQHLQLGPIIADQLLGFEGHQRIESLSGFGQSWTTREGVAESVNAGRGMNLVVKVTARARQSDILVQEVDTPDGRTAFVDADGDPVARNRQGSMVGGEMEVRVDGRTPVDIIDVQVKVGGGQWESVWGQDSDGFGAGAEELYRRYPSLRDELALTVFRFNPNQPRDSDGRWETINAIDSRGGSEGKWLSPEAAEEYWRRKSAGKRGPVDWEEDGDEMAASVMEQFHGNHDQKSHGNWARGSKAGTPIADADAYLTDQFLDVLTTTETRPWIHATTGKLMDPGGEPYGLDLTDEERSRLIAEVEGATTYEELIAVADQIAQTKDLGDNRRIHRGSVKLDSIRLMRDRKTDVKPDAPIQDKADPVVLPDGYEPASQSEIDAIAERLSGYQSWSADSRLSGGLNVDDVHAARQEFRDQGGTHALIANMAHTWSDASGVASLRQGFIDGSPEAKEITRIISSSPIADIPLFRGLAPTRDVWERFSALQPGDEIPNWGISGFTSKRSVAERFAGGGSGAFPDGVVVELRAGTTPALNITALSTLPQEREWLTSSNFRIMSIEKVRGTSTDRDGFDSPAEGMRVVVEPVSVASPGDTINADVLPPGWNR